MWFLRLRRFLKLFSRDALVLLFACRDPATPLTVKFATLLMIAYAISPIDVVPDVLLLLGWADDVALLMLGVPWLLRQLPPQVRAAAESRVDALRFRRGTASRW